MAVMAKPPASPPPDADFARHCADLMAASIGPCKARRMFGGWGFSCDGVSVAIIAYGVFYLKGDALTRAEFEAAGGQQFTYDPENGRKPMQMSYWTVPEDALESPALMAPWARLALQAALRQANAKPVKKAGIKAGASAAKAPAAKASKKSATSAVAQPKAATKKVANKATRTSAAQAPKGPRG